jgi:hydrogenase nickel incorporation protein HypA/HybF
MEEAAMHELAVCQQLLSQVERIAFSRDATSIDRIVVSAGPLSGIEPHLLEQAFTVARTGTLAQHANLDVKTSPVRIKCRSCGAENSARVNKLLCESCGGWQVEVVEGAELMLMSVELSGLPVSPRQTAGHARTGQVQGAR